MKIWIISAAAALFILLGLVSSQKYGGVSVGGGGTVQASPFIITTEPNAPTSTAATTTRFFGNVDPQQSNQFDIGDAGLAWRNIYSSSTAYLNNVVINGTCTGSGCSGGGVSGVGVFGSLATGDIVIGMNTSTISKLSGFAVVTSTSGVYMPGGYTLYATTTYSGALTVTGASTLGTMTASQATSSIFAWTTASGTTANIGNLYVTGTIDTKNGLNMTCAGVNCRKTVTLSPAGGMPGFTSGAGTSTQSELGYNQFRTSAFQPLTFNHMQWDWEPPKSWDGGTLNCKFDYNVTTTDANGVTWGIRALGMGGGNSMSASDFGATSTVTTVATTTNAITSTTGTSLTVGGNTSSPSIVKFDVSRSNVGASTNTASLIYVKCDYGVNKLTDL